MVWPIMPERTVGVSSYGRGEGKSITLERVLMPTLSGQKHWTAKGANIFR